MRDSTNPASRSTRRCLETDGCDSRSSRSISPTERSDESSRLRMARRLGSARMTNDDSTIDIEPEPGDRSSAARLFIDEYTPEVIFPSSHALGLRGLLAAG